MALRMSTREGQRDFGQCCCVFRSASGASIRLDASEQCCVVVLGESAAEQRYTLNTRCRVLVLRAYNLFGDASRQDRIAGDGEGDELGGEQSEREQMTRRGCSVAT